MADRASSSWMQAPGSPGQERESCALIDPPGFHLRPPPPPHVLSERVTPDDKLFETIHMGAAVVDVARWRLLVDGMVERPFVIDLDGLKSLPASSVTATHECYGSPLQPPVKALWRVGNVCWTGVPLRDLLAAAGVSPAACFVWSEGLDSGEFAGRSMDRYQKDLPLHKALTPEVLVAYEMNGETLRKERGGPVRLVVPGFFGTNMTKWLCRLSLHDSRASGPFTTTWYNETDPEGPPGATRPVWAVEPNSMIVAPGPGPTPAGMVLVTGWAWSADGVATVEVSIDDGVAWLPARVEPRHQFSWQSYEVQVSLSPGVHRLVARATSLDGTTQPLLGRRNEAHRVEVVAVGHERSSGPPSP